MSRMPQVPVTPPPAPAVPAAQAVTSIGGPVSVANLQAQLPILSGQIAGLSAERNALRAQLRSQRVTDRVATVNELNRTNNQLALSTGQLADVSAQLAVRRSIQGTHAVPPIFPERGMHPDLLVGLAFALVFAVMMPIAIAYARRIWRGKPKEVPPRDGVFTDARLERLEQAVDSIAIEIERVSEGQRFVTRVLTERLPLGASSDGAVRALGAGPIEPIRVAEREAVRQSITPH